MKGKVMTKAQLQAEVDRLRIEVALLRSMQAAHVCPQPVMPIGPSFPAPYVGDVWPYQGWTNVCAGAGVPATFMVNAAAANPPLVFEMPSVAAGAAAQPLLQTYWVNC